MNKKMKVRIALEWSIFGLVVVITIALAVYALRGKSQRMSAAKELEERVTSLEEHLESVYDVDRSMLKLYQEEGVDELIIRIGELEEKVQKLENENALLMEENFGGKRK